jgi:hypothetical protein
VPERISVAWSLLPAPTPIISDATDTYAPTGRLGSMRWRHAAGGSLRLGALAARQASGGGAHQPVVGSEHERAQPGRAVAVVLVPAQLAAPLPAVAELLLLLP